MASYKEARGKLINTQLDKSKFAAKNKIVTTLRIIRKAFKMKNYHVNYF